MGKLAIAFGIVGYIGSLIQCASEKEKQKKETTKE